MNVEPTETALQPLRVVGRYALYGQLATGGMATVHFGRLLGPVGFSRTVAVKRLHPQFAKDPEFRAMFLDEARVAARIQHPNVVATLDVVSEADELFLVMDYVRGESFSRLLRLARKKSLSVPAEFVGSVVAGALHGLHAAHDAKDERGQPLRVVHRDVSPQNVLVGVDGVARVLDFGVAKAAARAQVTREGQMKGKLSYMSPEQLRSQDVDRRSDVFAAGVMLWEAVAGRRLFSGDRPQDVLEKILNQTTPAPSRINPQADLRLDALVLRALDKDPDRRFQTAREFAIAVEEAMQPLGPRETGEWVEEIAGDRLDQRDAALAEIEGISSVSELSEPELPSLISMDDRQPDFHESADDATLVMPASGMIEEATQVLEMNLGEQTSPRLSSPSVMGLASTWGRGRFVAMAASVLVGSMIVGVLLVRLLSPSGSSSSGSSQQATTLTSVGSNPPGKDGTEPRAASGVHSSGVGSAAAMGGTKAQTAEPNGPVLDSAATGAAPNLPTQKPDQGPSAKASPVGPATGNEGHFDRATAVTKAPSKPKKRPAFRPKAKSDCERPFEVDENGIRRIKPQCL